MALSEPSWSACRAAHIARLQPVVDAHLERARNSIKHPIMDFMFTYYPYAPAQLLRWTPGWGVQLKGEIPADLAALTEAAIIDDTWSLQIDRLPERRREAIDYIIALLEATAQRAPRFGCFGLHEWAMVYRSEAIRHPQLPLRFSPDETARIVESLPVGCSHFDAFRFFTPAAKPLNRLQPTRKQQIELDQPGCLHVNMDLYKWSQQFYPWINSDIIADAFALATAIREVDMRASPYDVSEYGLSPIRIETKEGRDEYADHQRDFFERSQPLRRRMAEAFRDLRAALP